MKHKIILLFTSLSFLSITCFAQNKQIDSLKRVLSKALDDTSKVNLLINISKNFFSTSPDTAIAYAHRAKELAQKLNYRKGLARAYKNVGIGYYWQGNYVEAIRNYQRANDVFDSIGDKVGVANIQSNIGAIYFDQSDNEKALDYYLKSLKASEEAGDTFRIITACVNIGAVYADKPQTYDKALEYLHRALPLSLAIKDNTAIGMTTVNMGEVYFKRNDDTSALKYFIRSTEAFVNSENLPYSLNYIGKVYQKRKDYTTALKYHQQAYEFANKSGAKLDMAESLLGIATVQRLTGNRAQSITNFKQAEDIAAKLNANQELKDAYEGLTLNYVAQKDFSTAFKYKDLLSNVKDTLYNIDVDKKLQGVQFKFDLENKELRINSLNKDVALEKQIIRNQKIVRNGFIGGFAVMLLFAGVFLTQRNRITKEKHRSDELLHNILPHEIATELRHTGKARAKSFEMVTVLFTDFKNFTRLSEQMSAEQIVNEINTCYSAFDRIVTKYGVEKIKTIGDSYMCAGGLPTVNETHAENAVDAAIEMRDFIIEHKRKREAQGEIGFDIRIGVHSGPVVAGIVGLKKFAYDIWGDTVNTAARFESSSEPNRINISGTTYQRVKDKFVCIHRGKISAKNKDDMDMYFVERRV